jgi:hypothetical protein
MSRVAIGGFCPHRKLGERITLVQAGRIFDEAWPGQ